jgi:hypothetical protein
VEAAANRLTLSCPPDGGTVPVVPRPASRGGRTARHRAVRRWPTFALAGAGLACLLGGSAVLAAAPHSGPAAIGELSRPAAPPSAAAPAVPGPRSPAVPTPVTAAPIVAGAVPVGLAVPGRDVTAPVVAVGTDQAGALVVPDPPSTVGWWSPSALAGGSAGTTVLAGHVDSAAAGLGALSVLRRVEVGEAVVLRGDDGRVVRYRVLARRQYAKAELPPEVFAVGGPPRLVLITCGGRFDRATRHYEDNVIVFAEPAP